MTKAEAEMLVAHLAAAFPNMALREATVDVYANDLLDLDLERTAAVVKQLRQSEQWFPTIAQIRHAYAVDVLAAPDGPDAYAQALGPRDDRHPLVQAAKRRCGDEADWRETPTGIMRKRFSQEYESVLGGAMREIISPRQLPVDERREIEA